jgi:hypothetical protein
LNGIGAGPAETIQPAVIADIFFLHARGKWNTMYWVFYMGSLMVRQLAFSYLLVSNVPDTGRPHHFRRYGGPHRLAQLLVAQHRAAGRLTPDGDLHVPGNQMAPQAP